MLELALLLFCLAVLAVTILPDETTSNARANRPSPSKALNMLKEGNERFASGKSIHPNTDPARLAQAAREDQGDHAYATVIACSDSRVPVERIFDAGIMELFVIRVAGNVCNEDGAGSIEYGLCHVHTPLLVVLGHTKCGAVTTVSEALQGRSHPLECNIPPLVNTICSAVRRAARNHPEAAGDELVSFAVEENVWQSIKDLLMNSPAVRGLFKEGTVMIVGAIYDIGSGRVKWLPSENVDRILADVEASPQHRIEPFATIEP
jgi:carbonic anhydrase